MHSPKSIPVKRSGSLTNRVPPPPPPPPDKPTPCVSVSSLSSSSTRRSWSSPHTSCPSPPSRAAVYCLRPRLDGLPHWGAYLGARGRPPRPPPRKKPHRWACPRTTRGRG